MKFLYEDSDQVEIENEEKSTFDEDHSEENIMDRSWNED